MSEHTYHLQKYAGISTRHTCPQCGHKGEFTYYVDERNVPIDESDVATGSVAVII